MNLQGILLLGPTGSGKSPLGDWLEQVSLWGRRCHHFDFGANLRAVVAGQGAGVFTMEEVRFLRRVLEEGALLEDEHFPLATRILDAFVAQKGVQPSDLLVLDGLPRHLQQACALDWKITVIGVVQLDCDARTVAERLKRNSGGDRVQRQDDSEALVARKLVIYEERTRPLLYHYRERGTNILNVKVGSETQPAEIAARMEDWRNQR
ncbi:MAG: nucleoside monophosphate kinase [Verrucomicrobia bacterium]|nr:nucleoside monophosphate kinase [Verrucomicrobiota bacterium]